MSIKLTITDDQLAAAFSSLKTFGDIADLLEVRPSTLGYYLRPRSNNYKVFSLDKRTGGRRTIYSPVTPLKIIQRKLNQVLHAVYKGRSPAHGCVRGKSIVTNARGHLRKRIILNFDLEDFFPSIHFGRVKGMFEAKPYNLPPSVAVTLARICCHKAVLPAGAPTSPTVANMLCAQLDAQLKRLALASGCIYTRYVDDITFSTIHDRFSPAILYRDQTAKIWIIGDELKRIVSANGFRIHPTKTRVLPRTYRQEVTGLIVSDSLNVKRRFVRQVRAMLHALERWGLEAASDYFHGKFDRKQRANKKTDFARVLRGKIEFIGFVRGRMTQSILG